MNSLEGMSVLVTGASGFLGGAVKDELERLKARTISVVWPPSSEYAGRENAVLLDLSKPDGWESLEKFGSVDAIIHCAAVLPGALPGGDLLDVNQKMTYRILEWGVKKKISHFTFASTCRVYGLQSYPCTEVSPLSPPDLYAVSKISCEYMAKVMMGDAGIPSCSLRISAPYGPRSKAETVIRRFLLNSAQGLPITLYGSGSRSQDFVYEHDVARAFCMALAAKTVGVYNLAGGQSVSIKELATAALDLFGRNLQTDLNFSGEDAQEDYRGNFPVDAAFTSFGYRPETPLAKGLELTAKAWGLL
jgi:UDP-glucose 4-epimerase